MVVPDEEASPGSGGVGSLEPSLTGGGFLSEAVSSEEPARQGRSKSRTIADPSANGGGAIEPVPITLADPVTSGPSREMAQQQQQQAGEAPQEQPAPKRISTLFRVCPFILGNEFCERLAFYGSVPSPGGVPTPPPLCNVASLLTLPGRTSALSRGRVFGPC